MTALTLGEFAVQMTNAAGAMVYAEHRALERATQMVQVEAKRVMGTYDYGWVPLAQATVDDRLRQGFSPDEPLLRTGELRDSIERTIVSGEGYVGSNSMVAVWQELGTKNIPPRSFLMGAAVAETPAILEVVGREAEAAIMGREAAWQWTIGAL